MLARVNASTGAVDWAYDYGDPNAISASPKYGINDEEGYSL
jgi:hypothetical protein